MTHVVEHTDICAVCGEPVMGRADPRSGASVPAPEQGEAVLCLLCLLGVNGNSQADTSQGEEGKKSCVSI